MTWRAFKQEKGHEMALGKADHLSTRLPVEAFGIVTHAVTDPGRTQGFPDVRP